MREFAVQSAVVNRTFPALVTRPSRRTFRAYFEFAARAARTMGAENLDQSIGTAQPKTLLKAVDTIAFAEPGHIINPDNS
jgi:hypothetical protein